MSLVSVLQGLAGVAGQGFQGYAIDRQTGVKDALARDAAQRQAERDRVLNLLTQRQIAKPQLGDTSYAPAMAEVKGAETAAETPGLVSRANLMKPVEVSKAVEIAKGTPESHTPVVTTEPGTGKQVVSSFGVKSGSVTPTGADAKLPSAGGGLSGNAQNMQARLLGAVSEGRLADERMTAFESAHMKDGKLDVPILADVGAGLNTGLAGAHGPVGIITGRVAGGLMNKTGNAALLQYQRDARLIARAEQLMSARGGSEAMASDNAFLAAGSAGAPEATVLAARKSRQALFGKLGAVIQALTPEQITKLNAGLEALHQSDATFDNKSPLEQTLDAIDKTGLGSAIRAGVVGSAGTALPSISRAEYDALRAQGYADQAIRAKYSVSP